MPTFYTRAVETGYKLLSKMSPCNAWAHFQELQANQWLSYPQLCALRWEKLKKLLSFSYDNIPFYRKLWNECHVDPRTFRSEQEMVTLPIVTKEQMTAARERNEFLLDQRGNYEMASTSGTTGSSFKVPFSFFDFQKKYANHLRQVYASGWHLGMKSATLHYSGHTQFKGKYNKHYTEREPFTRFREAALRVAHRRLVLTPYYEERSGNDTIVESWYHQLKHYAPYMFETMDINLLLLKNLIERNTLPRITIPKIYVLATLGTHLRKSLEDFFNAEIFDRYSPHEIEGVAFACHIHHGMHAAIDSYYIEFLDDSHNPVGPQETGHLVITDLDSYLMPLIRYRVGDLGHYYQETCPCGRGLPLMGEIDGRACDRLCLQNGKKIAPAKITTMLQDELPIAFFQIVQGDNNEITINIVPGHSSSSSTISEKIKHELEELLGKSERIVFNEVTHINLEPNGKFCFIKRTGVR